ncbi:MAG: response regulator transcription factor [Kiritimatiellaeota bacterium]|nr:response regulator transcription factor [Kiritimatiellota bacterium]
MAKSNARVLVIEDEPDMARVLSYNLERHGCKVWTAGTGRAARDRLGSDVPDLVLLDLRLPDVSGLELLEELKSGPSPLAAPVIVVSALGDEETVVAALNSGADDYVTKPFRTRELLARVDRALARRSTTGDAVSGDAAPLRAGSISMDPETRETLAHGSPVPLTRTEFDLLAFFVRRPGRVFTRQQLCTDALGAGGSVQERTIDAHIRTIRRKLGPAGKQLVTVWGIGYRLAETPDAD